MFKNSDNFLKSPAFSSDENFAFVRDLIVDVFYDQSVGVSNFTRLNMYRSPIFKIFKNISVLQSCKVLRSHAYESHIHVPPDRSTEKTTFI